MPNDQIIIRGAREHNLKNIDLTLPRDKLIVITGLSGSGKSSLAFDTVYAEGQRRYVESLSAYARQFLGQMEKPDVDHIEGLSPAISIDQKGTSRNPRSTVGTVTEIYDYLRLMYARIGHPHCPNCGREISKQSIEQISDQVMLLPEGTRLLITAPMVQGRKGEHRDVFDEAKQLGYVRVRVDGELHDLSDPITLDKKFKHDVEVVVDRIIIGPELQSRLHESLEQASKLSDGLILLIPADPESGMQEMLFSEDYACVYCGISMEEPAPRNFSFNNPHGACPACTGLGVRTRGRSRRGGPRSLIEHRRGRALRMDTRAVAALDDGGPRDGLPAVQDPAQRSVERSRSQGTPNDPLRIAQGRDGAHALRLAQRAIAQL